ncbi:hydroxymethylglutaryl-CoA lyase [bacterium]|nr:hydroxymethylglutaryl-CoA lyase [bacterium]
MKNVKIVEVGLRDGLQNETTQLSVEQRYDLYDKLVRAGVKNIEIGAFVSPKWVPQMALTAELCAMVLPEGEKVKSKVQATVLVPNEQGMLQAIEAGVKEVAIFAACSESFSQKNINCSIDESFERFVPVMKLAKEFKIKVRGYLSTCFGCPFEGKVSEAKVVSLVKKMHKLGCYEISVGDTIGVANAAQVESLFKKLKKVVPVNKLAGHFHDTRGQALANILAAYNVGIRTFDSSIGGLGGCPYAPGAAGNVATEDVIYMFDGMKVKTGLKLDQLIDTHRWLQPLMDHQLSSKVGRVGRLKPIGKVQ